MEQATDPSALEAWVDNVLSPMAPHLGGTLRRAVADYEKGHVVFIAVARAPMLVEGPANKHRRRPTK